MALQYLSLVDLNGPVQFFTVEKLCLGTGLILDLRM